MILAAGAVADAEDRGGLVYLNEDAVISAKALHTFTVDGQTVNVLIEDFVLRLGRRVITGRDAVVWVREHRTGGVTLRDIEVYVEGDKASVVEPNGVKTTDRSIYIVLRQRGGLRARVTASSGRALASFPLYKRAVAMRRRLAGLAPHKVAPSDPPTLIRTRATGPADKDDPAIPTPLKPTLVGPHQPVTFRADTVATEEVTDPKDPTKKTRITTASGHVYLSQGNPDKDLFAEMRADSAVLYTVAGGREIGSEGIEGVYLEGDVKMRRGDRTVTGERLFYDFTTGRAIIIDPVFRLVQAQRNIPIYIRGTEARQLAAYEDKPGGGRTRGYRWYFRNAVVTTSDFYTPSYHIGSKRVYMEDTTPYDETGMALDEQGWRTELINNTFNLRGVPVFWSPKTVGDFREGHTALRKAQAGRNGRFGWGGESEWFLFRVLGIPRPDGYKGRLELSVYERGFIAGTKVEYERDNYSGYALAYGVLDSEGEDDFGTDREDIDAQKNRGRLLLRHKHFLPRDWELQAEFSYLCDRNFLEQFFPGEFWNDKPQDTLVYVKKQKGNWALTGLIQAQINNWMTTTEAYPDVAAYLIGKSLWQDRLTLHAEGHLGVVRYQAGRTALGTASRLSPTDSPATVRADVRHEINLPFSLGPVRVLPFAATRATYWQNDLNDESKIRNYGQLGFNAQMDIWRIHNNVRSRMWDLNRIKHIVTPYGRVFGSASNVESDEIYTFSSDIEQYAHVRSGATIGVRQLWQTKRGPAGNEHTVDWLRLDVNASGFTDEDDSYPGDGRYFTYRPEHSIARNNISADLAWQVSDSTLVIADANYDISNAELARINVGLVVVRDPRLRYFLGVRHIDAIDMTVGTVGFSYKINRKYTVSLFEQYDFSLEGGDNLTTSATLLRKFPRTYLGFTVVYSADQDDIGFIVTFWPEGIEEATIGGRRMSLMLAAPGEDH